MDRSAPAAARAWPFGDQVGDVADGQRAVVRSGAVIASAFGAVIGSAFVEVLLEVHVGACVADIVAVLDVWRVPGRRSLRPRGRIEDDLLSRRRRAG